MTVLFMHLLEKENGQDVKFQFFFLHFYPLGLELSRNLKFQYIKVS